MPTHRDTDYVRYLVPDSTKQFEVFTIPGKAAEYQRKKGHGFGSALSILMVKKIYCSVKTKCQAKDEELQNYFGTKDTELIVGKILLNGKLKVKVYKPQPMIELLLDTIFAFEIIGTLYVLIVSRTIFHFLILCFAVAWLVRISMGLSRTMGRYISKNFMAKEPFNNPLKSNTTLRQFESQMWQLIIHTSMSVMELWAYSKSMEFLKYPSYLLNAEQLLGDGKISDPIKYLYLTQLAVRFVTLISLRFFEVRASDHHVMYTHHVVTIGVVSLSYGFGRYTNFGLVVFMLHDISDVPLDIMKILDILHLQGPSAMYLAEIVYFVHMTIWGYCRLYLFPKNLLYYGVYGTIFMRKSPEGNTYWCELMKPGSTLHHSLLSKGKIYEWQQAYNQDCQHGGGALFCFGLLCTLQLLHVWWTYLLLRIGYRSLALGENSHEVAAQEYFEAEDEHDEDMSITSKHAIKQD